MPKKIAFLFPGQGSQTIGMGHDLMVASKEAQEIFHQVDEICGKPISRLCFEGPMDELTLTDNLQPAVTAVNLACLSKLIQSGITPSVSAGHSLGEYGALAAAGVVSYADALRLVQRRGALMQRESLNHPGTMAAVVGLGMERVSEIVRQTEEKGIIAVANHNTAEQIAITGEKEAVAHASTLVKESGGRALPLKVSGAWHCRLMENAVQEFRDFMEDIPFVRPRSAILFNATAGGESDPDEIKDIMARQLISPVRWYDIILKMMEDRVEVFAEVGPKKVLTGLLKKIIPGDRETEIYNVEDMKSIDQFLESQA
jgi:[acyl-carrier-protein] S-malonyltransferase